MAPLAISVHHQGRLVVMSVIMWQSALEVKDRHRVLPEEVHIGSVIIERDGA